MKENEAILKRQINSIRFKNEDMDFMLNWAIGISQIVGMSPSQVFHAVHGIKDGDPAGWRNGFFKQGYYQLDQAKAAFDKHQIVQAAQLQLGAAYAIRAGLQFSAPNKAGFESHVQDMEKSFQRGIELLGVPMRPIEVPFENTTLPGYYLEHDEQKRPVILMVGGGDTYREDLFYFAGYPGWKRGYNVIMVDLPGQGIMPNRGQHFRVDMDKPFSVVLDWLDANAAVKPDQIATYGVSGGGYFTTQGVAVDHRINAWIAATPIYDIGKVFAREFGSALKAPGWMINTFMHVVGAFNESAEINLDKYVWQFGTTDFKSTIDWVLAEAQPVDYTAIRCPSLFLVSEGEGDELKRQSKVIYDDFVQRGVDVTLREFSADEGADGHCELNNLRLLHLVVFDWLDRIFNHESGDIRLRC